MNLFLEKIKIPDQKYKHLKWSDEEIVFRKRRKLWEDYDVPLSGAIQLKFKKSVFGTYLDSFNRNQAQSRDLNENKLGITKWEIKNFSRSKAEQFKMHNDITCNLYDLLIRAVRECDCITWKFLYDNIEVLRIRETHVTLIDAPLLKFKSLRILSLSGNWIEHINGNCLPRTLQLLECFANSISNVESLCRSPPKGLLYVGLSRNKLANDCKLEGFNKCGMFKFMKCLDLSDNDIYYLLDVLEPLTLVKTLSNLMLEGNPCATCVAYKDAVLKYLPKLNYLDGVEILKKDRKLRKIKSEDLVNGAVLFTCHRIVGLPAPPKRKGVDQMIHVEVSFPLLQTEINDDERQLPKNTTDTNEKSYYNAEDEYALEQELEIKNTSFKTKRMVWAKIMQNPNEYLQIESPEQNLFALRDTFRSKVNIKVVYLMIRQPKPVKGKVIPQEPPQEEILTKITLASFYCNLHNINWSDKTIDFHWVDDPNCHENAIPVIGSLRNINYVEGKPPVPKKGSPPPPPIDKAPSKEYLPKSFTCQVGFGLKRLHQN